MTEERNIQLLPLMGALVIITCTSCAAIEEVKPTATYPKPVSEPSKQTKTSPPEPSGYPPVTSSDSTLESSGKRIHVKFRQGNGPTSPEMLLPPDLRKSVVRISPLFTLQDRELDRIGAGRMKLWYMLTVKEGIDADAFMEKLRRLENVEIVEPAPVPEPPP